jgi:hypothetical protein
MSYALYELALHPEIQHRVRTEITQVLDKNEGELTYYGIHEMSYLDMVVRGERTEFGYILRIVIFWIVKLHIHDRGWKRYVLTERWSYKTTHYNPGDHSQHFYISETSNLMQL